MSGFDRARPFNDLPPLPPAVNLESPAVLKKAIAAHRMLAELKGGGNVLPNQAILLNGIVLQEARLSSEIENILTTTDELYQAAGNGGEGATPEAKEVLRYREALWHGFKALKKRPLSSRLFVEIVRVIRQTGIDVRKVPGTRIANESGEVVYTPPEGESLIRDKLANLERFLHADDGFDPLVKMAVAHYQFEAIHPFTDGNGRTGRIINILFLVEQGLLELPVLYLSHYVMGNRGAYYEGLRRVTEEGAWEPWVLYMLDAVEVTARQTRERIVRIRTLMDEVQDLVRTKARKIYSKDLIELIFTQPYCRIRFLVDAGLAGRQTASLYLQRLEKLGVLRGRKAGREVYYLNTRLLKALGA